MSKILTLTAFLGGKMFKNQTTLLTILLSLAGSVYGFDYKPNPKPNEVRIPQETYLKLKTQKIQNAFQNKKEWQDFKAINGNLTSSWNEFRGNPHRVFGKPMAIQGFSRINLENAESAARAFLRENSSLLKVNESEIVLENLLEKTGIFYVDFFQTVNGVKVYDSRTTVRMTPNAKVILFGSDSFPEINPSNQLSISHSQAVEIAKSSIGFSSDDKDWSEEKTWVLPLVDQKGNTDFKFVHETKLRTDSPLGTWATFVDTENGNIVWRHNEMRHQTFSGNSHGPVETVPNNITTDLPMFNQHISIGSLPQPLTTDTLGNFAITNLGSNPLNLSSSFKGPWTEVLNQNGANSTFSAQIQPDIPFDLLWDNSNSSLEERDAFYHTNLAHDYIENIDPNFNGVDYQMDCNININDNCNAFWDGNTINFFQAGNNCNNTARIADVVYHEYAHGITAKQYGNLSPSGAMHEGLSDYYANTIGGSPLVGVGFFSNNPTGFLRTSQNTKMYPQDLTGEVHDDGEIIAGALWDLRGLIGQAKTDTLFQWAKYGFSDNFEDYLVDLIIADDNPLLMAGGDNDLSNSTPNALNILTAFTTNHGIGLPTTIAHDPVENAPASATSYTVEAQMSLGILLNPNSNPTLTYTVNGGQPQTIPMTFTTNDIAEADIPAQQVGSLVRYYITVQTLTGTVTYPTDISNGGLLFLVGNLTYVFEDHAESQNGWTLGLPTDDATSGEWIRDDPVGTDAQPEDDHTDVGVACFVTGNANPGQAAGANDVDGGITTLVSPIFDATTVINPIVDYYRWYSNDQGASPGNDFFNIQISNNGGSTWTVLENTNVSNNAWENFRFLISDFVTPTAQCQLRFIAQDLGQGSLVEAAVDDILVYGIGSILNIEHVALKDTENDSTDYPILAMITASNPLLTGNPFLSYSFDNVNYTNVSMIDPGFGTFTASIPFQPHGTTVYYYISANDTVGNSVIFPAQPHSFLVDIDTTPPVISDINVEIVDTPFSIKFTAKVTDNVGVDYDNTYLNMSINNNPFQVFSVNVLAANEVESNPAISLTPGDEVHYYFSALDLAMAPNSVNSDTNSVIFTSQEESENIAKSFRLSQNYPNPFNPSTSINYELQIANSELAKLVIFNVLGEKVKEFNLTESKGTVVWNGTDNFGKQVSSGVYFYKLESATQNQTRKMLLLK
ncbi:MAG: T9SS C-terminal target domain-containing protein [Calditrichaeota bacterium]|nr:MAG: T9SS C-terminal target domain-containing protein [Calditrichota bacterium]